MGRRQGKEPLCSSFDIAEYPVAWREMDPCLVWRGVEHTFTYVLIIYKCMCSLLNKSMRSLIGSSHFSPCFLKLMDQERLKKVYQKACLLVHPDRVSAPRELWGLFYIFFCYCCY